ncbi:hypothetical protein [Halorubellus sp. PRR65]|uniref:hypothetical protein n=1 Tax=Halorubellus sp. PRR65 TaxID=3098148 RepID=UPI002B256F0A|nr:hypothetical protein [Halorubellus sp. PRR65]
MNKDASAGEKPPALIDAQPADHHDEPAVLVHQTHRVTARGIETSTTLTTPDESQHITETVAHQLRHAFDVDPEAHGLDVVAHAADGGTGWTAGRNAARRASEGER